MEWQPKEVVRKQGTLDVIRRFRKENEQQSK